jgi:hypothetical protein
LAYGTGATNPLLNYVGAGVFTKNTTVGNPSYNPSPVLAIQKSGVTGAQALNPTNFKIENLKFVIRPICDPFIPNCTNYSSSYPKVQPTVVIMIKFTTQLPTGETVSIYYQTAVSSNKYDIPNQ